MDDKIVRIPITYSERKKNQMGDGYVPCYISSRYLMIQGVSECNDETIMMFDVMTENDEGVSRKICEMAIDINDLNEAVKKVKGNQLKGK